jgi:hypothetical protein
MATIRKEIVLDARLDDVWCRRVRPGRGRRASSMCRRSDLHFSLSLLCARRRSASGRPRGRTLVDAEPWQGLS